VKNFLKSVKIRQNYGYESEVPFFGPPCIHELRVRKKQDAKKLLPITSPNVNRFSQFFFAVSLTGKFATNSYLNIPSNRKYVVTLLVTLPCEI